MQLYPTAQTPTDIRRLNRHAILSLLRQHGALSKSDLLGLTERTITTITTILDELIREDLVEVIDRSEYNQFDGATFRGRPASLYRLSGSHWIVAGMEIASDSVTAAILNLDGSVLDSASVLVPSDLQAADVLDIATDLLQRLLEWVAEQGMELLGIGIALEGFVDVSAGLSLWMLFRSQWKEVPIAAHFKKHFNVPVLVDYRVYAAALAEAVYGAGRGVSDFAYLNVDTGVATASVASGRLVRSSAGPAGVTGGLGHVVTTGGTRLCYCGKVGCLHTEITTKALLTQLRELISISQGSSIGEFWQAHAIRFDNLILAAQQREPLALQLRGRLAQNLGMAVSSAAQLFSANMIIIGGAAVQFGGDEAIDAANRALQQITILHSQFGLTKVVASNLLPDPATVGAVTLIVEAVMDGQLVAASKQRN